MLLLPRGEVVVSVGDGEATICTDIGELITIIVSPVMCDPVISYHHI